MLQRILAVNYELPSHVAMSADCRNLLSRILVADPGARMTVPHILAHPWFLRGLPPGVAEMNDRLVPPRASEIRTFSMPDGVQVRSALAALTACVRRIWHLVPCLAVCLYSAADSLDAKHRAAVPACMHTHMRHGLLIRSAHKVKL